MGFNAQLAGQNGNHAKAVALSAPFESLLLSDVPELGVKATKAAPAKK